MTDRFVVRLFLESKEDPAKVGQGIEPIEIWKKLNYNAFHENVIPLILNKLIKNNIDRKFITFDRETNKVVRLIK
jgi:hypothetical protein